MENIDIKGIGILALVLYVGTKLLSALPYKAELTTEIAERGSVCSAVNFFAK